MKQLLDHIGISRQALHQGYRRMIARQGHLVQTCELADQVRQHHPGMNCRDVYWCMAGEMPRGRDWTEQILLQQGFGVKARARSFTKAGEHYVANLIEGLQVSGVNQLWQTDITYVWSGRRWHYVSFIIDVYSRQVLASHCSKDLSSKTQIACLQKAVKAAGAGQLPGLIVHTDRGVQYTSSLYKSWLMDRGIRLSMARYAWENAYCERVHRTIKANYLTYYRLDTYEQLQAGVARAVKMYNGSKPHGSLPGRRSPDQFVKELIQGSYPGYNFKIWSKLTSTKTLHVN